MTFFSLIYLSTLLCSPKVTVTLGGVGGRAKTRE